MGVCYGATGRIHKDNHYAMPLEESYILMKFTYKLTTRDTNTVDPSVSKQFVLNTHQDMNV